MDINKVIRDVNEYADDAILDAKAGSKRTKKSIRSWLNSGAYNLTNKHLVVWGLVTGAICFLF